MHLLRSRLQVNSAFRQELSTSPIRFRPKFTPRFHPVEAPARYRRLEQPQHQPARSRQIRCRSNRARPLQKWKQAGARLHQGPSDCRRPRSTRLCLIARRLNRRVHPPRRNRTRQRQLPRLPTSRPHPVPSFHRRPPPHSLRQSHPRPHRHQLPRITKEIREILPCSTKRSTCAGGFATWSKRTGRSGEERRRHGGKAVVHELGANGLEVSWLGRAVECIWAEFCYRNDSSRVSGGWLRNDESRCSGSRTVLLPLNRWKSVT